MFVKIFSVLFPCTRIVLKCKKANCGIVNLICVNGIRRNTCIFLFYEAYYAYMYELVLFLSIQYSSEEGHDLDIKPPKVSKGKKKASIYDVYEPSELERGHYTEKDVEIRVTDMPERFQV